MKQHLWRYVEDGKIIGGPQDLPKLWRDRDDLSTLPADHLRALGWYANMLDDQTKPGEEFAGETSELRPTFVLQITRSRPPAPPDPEALRKQEIERALEQNPTLRQLRLMTNAELETWVTANTQTLAGVRTLLVHIVKLIIFRLS